MKLCSCISAFFNNIYVKYIKTMYVPEPEPDFYAYPPTSVEIQKYGRVDPAWKYLQTGLDWNLFT